LLSARDGEEGRAGDGAQVQLGERAADGRAALVELHGDGLSQARQQLVDQSERLGRGRSRADVRGGCGAALARLRDERLDDRLRPRANVALEVRGAAPEGDRERAEQQREESGA